LLHVVGGEAVVAAPNDRAVVGPGDTVTVPAGEWHWHGGLPHVAAVLLVIERPADVSWDAPARDWSTGYDSPPTDEHRGT
jgi:quercetin dioxygenase-like cupin family protein